MVYLENINTAFVLVPKTGSEAIRNFFIRDSKSKRIRHGKQDHIDVQTAIDLYNVPVQTRFISVIRDPIERQLSLYRYRHRQRRYNTPMSREDFRQRMSKGYLEDHPHQMQLQSTFSIYQGIDICEWWPYEKLNELFKEFGTLDRINVSGTLDTRRMINEFYDEKTLNNAKEYWLDDIILYEKMSII